MFNWFKSDGTQAAARRLSEADFKKAKQEAELVFQLVPSAVYTVDTEKRVTGWNRRAANGREALDLLASNVFSLVLMDMEMPVMDGLTAGQTLRATEAGKKVPIVAFSAHEDSEKIKACLDSGCTDYLLKPVKKSRLLGKIHKYL